VVPVFLPHAGCRHRCVFCNQNAVSGTDARLFSPSRIRHAIDAFLAGSRRRKPTQIAFYGGTFLGLSENAISQCLELAAGFISSGRVDSIRFSTRPDTVDDRRMALIRPFPVKTVELGVQSLDDRVLATSRRGHTAADAVAAHRQLRRAGYRTGLQLMIGLPGQNRQSVLETAKAAAALSPDFVRIYPTVVLEKSPLARLYRENRYRPLPLEEAVSQTAAMFRVFSAAGIAVVRMGLQATPQLVPGKQILAGPHHPAFGEQVRSAVILGRVKESLSGIGAKGQIRIDVHPRLESQLRGPGNRNLRRIAKDFKLTGVSATKNADLDRGIVRIETGGNWREVTVFPPTGGTGDRPV
jgi:histone acetyltransferase (RNA polymerase elongator complex component)